MEFISASGISLLIGSIGSKTVLNIIFLDAELRNSHKGNYLKFLHGSGELIEDTLFERIVPDTSSRPFLDRLKRKSASNDLCYANPCLMCYNRA